MSSSTNQRSQELLTKLASESDIFITEIPKVELHVHLEGTLTPELRWKFAKRHSIAPNFGNGPFPQTLDELRLLYSVSTPDAFFPVYFSGFELLRTRQDFNELALNYFRQAASMQVRYCEIFFDPQGHIRRGVSWSDMMDGLREARETAATELNVKSFWIACFERDLPVESALDHYEELLKYRDMVLGIGLASNEDDYPPALFNDLFLRARQDGFKVTAHCNVGARNTHEHIRQVASSLAGSGADRIDHGINAADKQELINVIIARDLGLTLVPCAYVRFDEYDDTANRLKTLSEAGIKLCICSDDPAYVGNCWITHNMILAKKMCHWTDEDVAKMVTQSVGMSWATEGVKSEILAEIEQFMRHQHKKSSIE